MRGNGVAGGEETMGKLGGTRETFDGTGRAADGRKKRRRLGCFVLGLFSLALAASGCGKEKAESAGDAAETSGLPADSATPGVPGVGAPLQDGGSAPPGAGSTQGTKPESAPPGAGTTQGTKPEGAPSDTGMPGRADAGETSSDAGGWNEPETGDVSPNTGMPSHADAGETLPDAGRSEETEPEGSPDISALAPGYQLELTPVQNLAPGEHYIFIWKNADKQRNLRIYDENWNCSAAFEGAACHVAGVTDARYVEISFLNPLTEGIFDTNEKLAVPTAIYDLVENKFVDFSQILQEKSSSDGAWAGNISILDGVRGYFLCTGSGKYGEKQVIDRNGDIIVDHIWIGEEGETMLYRRGSLYEAVCSDPDREEDVWFTKIFDPDFRLKAILYDEEEEIPAEGEREDGVFYGSGQEGYVFSAAGDALITKERFLAQFGDGEDAECTVHGAGVTWEQAGENRLYPVEYAGQTWYVDTKLNAYIREGETRMTILDAAKAPASYYVAEMEDGEQYFAPDGSPLLQGRQVKNPRMIIPTGNESYMLVGRKKEDGILVGYEVETVVPEDDYVQVQLCEFLSLKPRGILCLSPYAIAFNGRRAKEYGEMQEELRVYKKGKTLVFSAKEVGISQAETWDGSVTKYEDIWIVSMWDGKQKDEKTSAKSYIYTLLADGEVCFTVPVMGMLSDCHDGYLQMQAAGNIYVYDYSGKLIIKLQCEGAE